MISMHHVWALVLAGGEGKRLHALTTKPCGTPVPKQFCSLRGERSLIEDAIERAGALVDTERICAIVAAQHRRWWSDIAGLKRLPAHNLIVQPRNRGTAVGILYATLQILKRDPQAVIVLLPSDHHVDDEDILRQSLVAALRRARRRMDSAVLLGLEPDHADTELGYIVPGAGDPLGGHRVLRFIEKPSHSMAHEIIGGGALWNTFILIAGGQCLTELFQSRFAELVVDVNAIVEKSLAPPSADANEWDLMEMYERLPDVDFSRHLLEGRESSLCVVRVQPCGWSDLGTPRRVGETLRRLRPQDYAAAIANRSPYMNLAAQHDRLRRQA